MHGAVVFNNLGMVLPIRPAAASVPHDACHCAGRIIAELAQLVERDLAKVEATSSSLVFRSMTQGAFARKVHGPARPQVRPRRLLSWNCLYRLAGQGQRTFYP
jgi:hypothetical protein